MRVRLACTKCVYVSVCCRSLDKVSLQFIATFISHSVWNVGMRLACTKCVYVSVCCRSLDKVSLQFIATFISGLPYKLHTRWGPYSWPCLPQAACWSSPQLTNIELNLKQNEAQWFCRINRQISTQKTSPTVTLTWHANKYTVHKLHQRCILVIGCPPPPPHGMYIYRYTLHFRSTQWHRCVQA